MLPGLQPLRAAGDGLFVAREPRAQDLRRPMPHDTTFPQGFLWGAATSAYQIEGSPLADGAGPSIWHRFSHTPGRTLGGAQADVACDHYRRWREDLALMRELGLNAYRFSLSWSRILPAGRGRVNPPGLDFYRRLVDALLEAGIRPAITLHHWDLPAVLDDLGGWRNPDSAQWFADYAEVAFAALGDRVPLWATLNEPWVIAHDGFITGVNAPGHRNLYEAPIVSHHLLRAHGAAVQRYRAGGWKRAIGLVVNLEPKEPASPSTFDVAAAARADIYFNRQYLDPVCYGRTPDGLRDLFGDAWPEFPAEDMRSSASPSTSWASTTTRASSSATTTRRGPRARAACPCRARSTPRPAGRCSRRG